MESYSGKQCSYCGAANYPEAQFCFSCGSGLSQPGPYATPDPGAGYTQPQAGPYAQPQPPQYVNYAMPAGTLTCPRCGGAAKRGSYQAWQIIVAICFFPIGLLALLADRSPTVCMYCGYSWQA